MNQELKCIIVDDEEKDRENLKLLLNNYCSEVSVIGEARDEKSIIELFSNSNPDIVFLDIQIGNLLIFEILNRLRIIDFHIVFVSAYDSYAIKGYQYGAVDYILKPIDPDKLIAVIKKIHKLKKDTTQREIDLATLKKTFQNSYISPKIPISDTKGTHILAVYDIIYCIGEGNYTKFVMNNNIEILISKNLKQFENKLTPYNFLRIHKSYLINLDKIKLLSKKQGVFALMDNGKEIPVSRTFKKNLYEAIEL